MFFFENDGSFQNKKDFSQKVGYLFVPKKKLFVGWPFWDLSPICFKASGYYSSGIQKAAMGFIKFIGLWVKGPKIRIVFSPHLT